MLLLTSMVNGPQPSVSVTENNGSRGASTHTSKVKDSGGQTLHPGLKAVNETVYIPGVVKTCVIF